MKRRFRLTRSNDIKRVRRVGKSYAHPLIVLVISLSPEISSRIAIITGKSVGGAVERNRVRRRVKAICDKVLPEMKTGFQAVLIGRAPSGQATYKELENSVKSVFRRAGLIQNSNE
ncbi:MAG TPA: ribonuclease P protein component [Leptolinea sp.]